MSGGVFPHFSSDDAAGSGVEEAYDSERRLAYVALTRGQETVKVMAPKKNYLGKDAVMSKFIAEACLEVRKMPESPISGDIPDENPDIVKSSKVLSTSFGKLIADSVDEMINEQGEYLFTTDPNLAM